MVTKSFWTKSDETPGPLKVKKKILSKKIRGFVTQFLIFLICKFFIVLESD